MSLGSLPRAYDGRQRLSGRPWASPRPSPRGRPPRRPDRDPADRKSSDLGPATQRSERTLITVWLEVRVLPGPPSLAVFRVVRARMFAFDSRLSLANRWPRRPGAGSRLSSGVQSGSQTNVVRVELANHEPGFLLRSGGLNTSSTRARSRLARIVGRHLRFLATK